MEPIPQAAFTPAMMFALSSKKFNPSSTITADSASAEPAPAIAWLSKQNMLNTVVSPVLGPSLGLPETIGTSAISTFAKLAHIRPTVTAERVPRAASARGAKIEKMADASGYAQKIKPSTKGGVPTRKAMGVKKPEGIVPAV
eukprot:239242-Prymnesium_polylepis.6